MITIDPILETEKIVREINDKAGKYTQPVLKRYPLLFSFLIFFSVAAILTGFELIIKQTAFLEEHPSYLIMGGIVMLFFTGMLYKALEKNRE